MQQDEAREALAAIRRKLDEERRRSAAREQERREREIARSHDAELFRATLKDAIPLAQTSIRAERPRPPAPAPASRHPVPATAAATTDLVLSDGIDTRPTADDDVAPSFARAGVSPQTVRRLRRGEWPVDAQIDLHGRSRDQARAAIGRFLGQAADEGWRCARVVHGKGIGSANGAAVLGPLTRHWLAQSDQVLAYVQPPDSAGGAGALLVLLRPGRRTPS